MSITNTRFLKISVSLIGILLTICGALLLVGFSSHSEADLQDRTNIQHLAVQTSSLETGLASIQEDVKIIRRDIREMKMFLLREQ